MAIYLQFTEEDSSGGHISALYSRDASFESRPTHRLSWGLSWFPQSLQA
jgi:hypothetical protein